LCFTRPIYCWGTIEHARTLLRLAGLPLSPRGRHWPREGRLRHCSASSSHGVTALGLWGRLEAKSHPAEFGFTMSTLHSRIGNRESWKTGACQIASGSYLESTLARKRGRGLATPASLLRVRPCLSLAESYSCTINKNNPFGLILLQKKVGGHPSPEVIH